MKLTTDKDIIKNIFSFAGWNFIGASSGVLRDQGVNVLLNVFCGPTINAARGISMQVNSAVSQFSTNFLTAINPQITKSYANGAKEHVMSLVFQGARFTVYLLCIISIPIIFEADNILILWLKTVPKSAVSFVRLVLVYQLIEAISYTMVTMMLANGNIKRYQIIVGGFQLLNFPLAYVALKFGIAPKYTLVISIIIAIICLISRLNMLSKMEMLNIKEFAIKVILNVFSVFLISSIIPFFITNTLSPTIIRLFITCSTSIICTIITILYVGCSINERKFLFSKLREMHEKFKNR